MKVEEAKVYVRIIASGRKLSLPALMANGRDIMYVYHVKYSVNFFINQSILSIFILYSKLAPSLPPRLRTGAMLMLILKYLSTILYMLYTYKPSLPIILPIKKPHQNPLGNFKDLSIRNDRGKRLCFKLCSDFQPVFIQFSASIDTIKRCTGFSIRKCWHKKFPTSVGEFRPLASIRSRRHPNYCLMYLFHVIDHCPMTLKSIKPCLIDWPAN
jgi:hypothetical protein